MIVKSSITSVKEKVSLRLLQTDKSSGGEDSHSLSIHGGGVNLSPHPQSLL